MEQKVINFIASGNFDSVDLVDKFGIDVYDILDKLIKEKKIKRNTGVRTYYTVL